MTENESHVSMEYLRECVETPENGVLLWKSRPRHHFNNNRAHATWNGKYAGTSAGAAKKGYRTLRITPNGLRLQLQSHRVLWALVYGAWPEQHIDHINRDRSDNRMENLRDVAPDVNSRNNGNPRGTGLIGAYRRPSGFMAQIKGRYLGFFRTAEEASAAFHRAKASDPDLNPVSFSASASPATKEQQ